MTSDEIRIVEQAKQDKKGAVDMLMETYYADVLYFAMSKVGRDRAEDIVQRTMLKVLENIGSLQKPSAFKSWMFSIANNECKNVLIRDARDRRALDLAEIEDDHIDTDEYLIPEECLISKERQQLVVEALQALPQDHIDCLTLFYYQDMSYAEIAQVLNMPVSKVKSDLYRGKQLLKKMLEGSVGSSSRYAGAPVLGLVIEQSAQAAVTPEGVTSCQDYLVSNLAAAGTAAGAASAAGAAGKAGALKVAALAVGGLASAAIAGTFIMAGVAGDPVAPEESVPVSEAVQDVDPPRSAPQADALPEPAVPIETLADMIGETEANALEDYSASGVSFETLQAFVRDIGALDEDVAADNSSTYNVYSLSRQDKQLLVIAKIPIGETGAEVRYLFREMAEIPPMIELRMLFS